MLGNYENVDRRIKEPELEPVDVLIATLDAETYLEKCLDSIYKEIPVSKVIVVDGGSKDRTVEILNQYPRMDIHVRPDIRTTGKGLEFMFSRTTTPWIAIIDADIELPPGWYDEMARYKDTYDFFGCKRITHYEFYRVDPSSLDINNRPLGAPWLARRDCFNHYHVDDDYMWRAGDMLLRQAAEKSGYKFGKVATTYHYHHTTDSPMYESDKEKRGSRLVFEEPKMEVLNKANWEKRMDDFRKAVVKYIEPEFVYPRGDEGLLSTLMELDLQWVKETNARWYDALVEYRKSRRWYNVLVRYLAKYRQPKYIKLKFKKIGSYTAIFILAITKDFKDYVKHIFEY